MSDLEPWVLAWALTATLAAIFYYVKVEKLTLVTSLTVQAMRKIAKGEATATLDNEGNLRIKTND